MKNEALVSIIIPVYNKEKYILECLSCVIRQTWKNIEIVAVDDGSDDDSLKRLLSCKDSRIKTYQTDHLGVSSARNEGIRHAHGDFITFVDADDFIPPEYVERLLSAIEDADICICPILSWYRSSDSFQVSSCSAAKYTRSEFLHTKSSQWVLCSNACAKLFSASFLQKYHILFKESVDYGEDTLFFFNCLQHAERIHTTDLTHYIYRVDIQNSLIDRKLSDLQTNKNLMSMLHSFCIQSRDEALSDLIVWKQLTILYTIGKIECFQKNRKGSEFFSCAEKYNLTNRSCSGKALFKSEKLTRFTLKAHWFFPFYISIRIMYKNVKDRRNLFGRKRISQSEKSAINDINRIIREVRTVMQPDDE